MNARDIRENCYACGNRMLVLMKGSTLPTDFCKSADMECSKISACDVTARIPKTKVVRKERPKKPREPKSAKKCGCSVSARVHDKRKNLVSRGKASWVPVRTTLEQALAKAGL